MSATATVIKYNQIPKESTLLKNIPKLGKDERVTYRIIGSVDPLKPGKLFGASLILPGTDVITDPETGETYDIGFVESIGPGGTQITSSIEFADYSAFRVVLHGSRPEDQKKFKFLELSNYLKDNPNSDPSKHKIERVNEGADLAIKRDRRSKINAALNAVAAMNDKEIHDFIRANRLPDHGTADSRRAQVEDIAEKAPDKFEKMPVIDYQSLFDTIDEAKKKKVISYNNVSRLWQRFDGTPILQIKKGFANSIKDELAQFLMRPEGHKTLEWIKAEVKK